MSDKLFRTNDRMELRNVRIMKVDEPKELNEETTLCSFSVISQPGNDKDQDVWVRVTGKNGLAERIFNSAVGDRVNVAGKPFFRAYLDKDGAPKVAMEIKFPEYIDFLSPRAEKTEGTVEEVVEEKVEAPAEKRKPGRPSTKSKTEIPF